MAGWFHQEDGDIADLLTIGGYEFFNMIANDAETMHDLDNHAPMETDETVATTKVEGAEQPLKDAEFPTLDVSEAIEAGEARKYEFDNQDNAKIRKIAESLKEAAEFYELGSNTKIQQKVEISSVQYNKLLPSTSTASISVEITSVPSKRGRPKVDKAVHEEELKDCTDSKRKGQINANIRSQKYRAKETRQEANFKQGLEKDELENLKLRRCKEELDQVLRALEMFY